MSEIQVHEDPAAGKRVAVDGLPGVFVVVVELPQTAGSATIAWVEFEGKRAADGKLERMSIGKIS